jgi:hypothetical protein
MMATRPVKSLRGVMATFPVEGGENMAPLTSPE